MPSPHLDRKLKEVLGEDAGRELGAVTDRVDPIRGDIGELRHEVQRDIAALGHRFDLLQAEMATFREGVRADISDAFAKQTRWMLGGLALLLTAILFKG